MWRGAEAAAGRGLGSRHSCKESTPSFTGSSQKTEAPESACETVGDRSWDGSAHSLGGETKADFTEPSFQLGSWRGTHLGIRERGWDGAERGVQFNSVLLWAASHPGTSP